MDTNHTNEQGGLNRREALGRGLAGAAGLLLANRWGGSLAAAAPAD